MRKNKFFIAGLVTVFVALVSLTLVSSTWAKYTSTVTGTDSAKVAKWAWKYEGTALDLDAGSVTFNLLETVEDYGGGSDADVAPGVMAPGTKGQFVLEFENVSEVNGKIEIAFDVENAAGIPLEYSLNNAHWGTDLEALVFEEAVGMNDTSTCTVYWRWAFESGDDEKDTDLGIAEATITVKATVTFEQVD